jgi:hypothetical protein
MDYSYIIPIRIAKQITDEQMHKNFKRGITLMIDEMSLENEDRIMILSRTYSINGGYHAVNEIDEQFKIDGVEKII